MATTFKTLTSNDVVSTRSMLHESIPVTGTIVSGTYTGNIRNYSHGMFQSVYDYPYLSSSANHIFDLTAGYAATSSLSSSTSTQNAKKINIYNELSQILVGYDDTGKIRRFDEDGDLTQGTKNEETFFINLARLLTKDEIKKGSFTLTLGVNSSSATPFRRRVTIKDALGDSNYKVNSPAGEYGLLYISNSSGVAGNDGRPLNGITGSTQQAAGLLYYQAGIAVLSASVFGSLLSSSCKMRAGSQTHTTVSALLTGSSISGACDAFRARIDNVSFNNTTELNSTVYFCRANHNEFNYSANPTYLSASKLVVKNQATDSPVSYVTAVGLYSPDNELLAVAKLSEPLKKDPTNEMTIRVRLDY